MSAADTPAHGVEPGDATMLVHVAAVSALLASAGSATPRECVSAAADLVCRGRHDGLTRAEFADQWTWSDEVVVPPEERRAARALAAYLLALDEPAGERRQPEAGEVGP